MKTGKKTNAGNAGDKNESSYPVYALDEATKIAEAVRDLGGSRAPISKSLLAKHLKYAEKGPSFFQRVGAAKAFGLIEGWGSYSLTEQAKRYFYPTNDSDKNGASIAFLSAPSAFSVIIQRFDGGKLPSNEMIGNIMHKDASVPISWKDRLAGIFVRSAQFVGVVDADGFLRCKAFAQQSSSSDNITPSLPEPAPSGSFGDQKLPSRPSKPENNENCKIWEFKDGDSVIRLETPTVLSLSLWKLLDNYVQYLKPNDVAPK